MARRLKIRIFSDGMIQAESEGIKGKRCTEYIRILEEMLQAETVKSRYTPEYYEPDEQNMDQGAIDTQTVTQGNE